MGFKERLLRKKKELLDQYNRGKQVTEQMRAEKLRRHRQKVVDMRPGAAKAIVEGLELHKGPLDVMRDEYSRRKLLREERYGKKTK